jgi:hypothetical protein
MDFNPSQNPIFVLPGQNSGKVNRLVIGAGIHYWQETNKETFI